MATKTSEIVNLFRPFDFKSLSVLLISDELKEVEEYLKQNSQNVYTLSPKNNALSVFDKKVDVLILDSLASLNQAQMLLKEDGVLFVVQSNPLSLNHFMGEPEVTSYKIGESICGYALDTSAPLLTAFELQAELSNNSFSLIDKFFVFPNIKTPSSLLSEKLIDELPQLASDIAIAKPFVSDTEPYFRFFPEVLSLPAITKAGNLKEFASAFLWVASKGPSATRLKVTTSYSQFGQIGWYFSTKRKIPSKTVFVSNPSGNIEVQKSSLNPITVEESTFKGESLKILWKAIPAASVSKGNKLRNIWANLSYYSKPESSYRLLKEFISWSFNHWEIPTNTTAIQGQALDAVVINAAENEVNYTQFTIPRSFELFDLEWKLEAPMPKSWFIFRTVFSLKNDFDLFKTTPSYRSLKELYEALCKDLLVTPVFEVDVLLEAEFQSLVTLDASKEKFQDVITQQCLTPFTENYYPRDPKREFKLRTNAVQLELEKKELQATLNRPIYRLIAKLELSLKKHPLLKKILKAFSLYPYRIALKFISTTSTFFSKSIPLPLEASGNFSRTKICVANNKMPKRGWVKIKIKLNQALETFLPRLEIKSRGISFYIDLETNDFIHYEALIKQTDEIEDLIVEIPASNLNTEVTRVSVRQISKIEAAIRLVPPQIPSMLKNTEILKDFLQRGKTLWKDGKVRGLIAWIHQQALMGKVSIIDYYSSWISLYDTLNDTDRKAIKERIRNIKHKPLISVILPVYNTDEQWLVPAIESVINQLYPNWELCIADDASTKTQTKKVIEKYAKLDPRIKVVYRQSNGHISACSNSALELASGEFTALFDHDDILREHALYHVVEALNNNPNLDMLYSDEDKIDLRGRRFQPNFKPEWNEELFYSYNLVTHLAVFRSQLIKDVGGFRVGYEGSQDYDLVLRVVEKTTKDKIHHIPYVLYHWRAIPGSTAGGPGAKQYAYEAGRRAIRDHFKRMNIKATITEGISGCNRVQYELPDPTPLVSCIICTRDRVELLKVIVDGILHETNYPNLEVLIINNQSAESATLQYFESLKSETKVRVIDYNAPFNFSAINNFGAKHAKGEIFAFLNNDLKVIHADWLTELVRFACQKNTGAVGAKLYYPDGSLQHGGVVLGIGQVEGYSHGIAGHSHKGFPQFAYGFIGRTIVNQCFSAVTAACLVTRKSIFEKVGGFDENKLAVAFNDIDLCLRIREQGYLITWTPYSQLYHFESATRGSDQTPQNFPRFQRECDYMMQRWGRQLGSDPAYNPNLTLEKEDFSLAFPPRVTPPWKTQIESKDTKVTTPSTMTSSYIERPVTTHAEL